MLTPLELDIMKAVWRRSPSTVRDVQFAIRPARKLAYTTVMTIMDRMFHKGLLSRTLKSRAHMYEPNVRFADVRDAAVGGLLDSFFEGSKEKLRAFLDGPDGLNGSDGDTELTEPVTGISPSHPSSMDESLL